MFLVERFYGVFHGFFRRTLNKRNRFRTSRNKTFSTHFLIFQVLILCGDDAYFSYATEQLCSLKKDFLWFHMHPTGKYGTRAYPSEEIDHENVSMSF